MKITSRFTGGLLVLAIGISATAISARQNSGKIVWKSVAFAIVQYNDAAPKSWGLYHTEKKGFLLLRLWKRYLLIDVAQQQVFDIDPQRVKVSGDQAEFSRADIPEDPVDISEWKERDAGPVQHIRFRFGEKGNYLDLEIPLTANGKPAY